MRTCCLLKCNVALITRTPYTLRKHPIKNVDFIFVFLINMKADENIITEERNTRIILLLFLSKDSFYKSQKLVLIIIWNIFG